MEVPKSTKEKEDQVIMPADANKFLSRGHKWSRLGRLHFFGLGASDKEEEEKCTSLLLNFREALDTQELYVGTVNLQFGKVQSLAT